MRVLNAECKSTWWTENSDYNCPLGLWHVDGDGSLFGFICHCYTSAASTCILHYCCVSCLVVSNSFRPHGCSLPGSSVRGILQARVLEWVAMPFPKGPSRPRDWSRGSCFGRWVLYCLSRWGLPSILHTEMMSSALAWNAPSELMLGCWHTQGEYFFAYPRMHSLCCQPVYLTPRLAF